MYQVEGSGPTLNLRDVSTAGSRLTIVNGDSIRFVVTYSNTQFLGQATQNGSNSTSISAGFVFPLGSAPAANTGRWTINILGGSQAINDWTIESDPSGPAPLYKDVLFVGDDSTYGAWQDTGIATGNRWAAQLITGAATKTGAINAGYGDCTSEVIIKLPQILALKPQYVVINIGGVDIAEGVSSGTWQANLVTIRDTLKAEGINIIWLYVMPRNDFDVTSVNTYISATFTDTIIDTFTPLKDGGTGLNATYDIGDGIHINPAGADLIFTTITGIAPFLTA